MQKFPWGHTSRYNDFQTAFRRMTGGQKVQKISVDPGFTCPNRDGRRGKGGCTYCNNASFSPGFTSLKKPVSEQVEEGIRFFAHKYQGMHYHAYFQSYTNTYAPLQQLKDLYEEALRHPLVDGLVIATRPDCVNDEILDYLAEVASSRYVMVEYGVESHLDTTLEAINRGHTWAESVDAIRATARRGIHTTAHLVLGFPGEKCDDWMEQAILISQLPVENLKLHQLQIHKNTVMAYQYRKDPSSFRLFEAEEYATLVADYLERLSPRITIERFTSQAPADILIAPSWGIKNYVFTAKVNKLLKERNTWQGRLHSDK